MPTFDALSGEYTRLWRDMQLSVADHGIIESVAKRAIKNKPHYVAIEQQFGVPWFLVAVLHNRECGMSFNGHLHNGDPLTARTVHVPAGRPVTGQPPFSWEESAADALTMPPHELHKVHDWSIERLCYEAEKYNGWGYRNHAAPSAYLWSKSNNYSGGKYVADGVWSSAAVDQQIGCMPLLRVMMEFDPAISEALDMPAPAPAPAPKPVSRPKPTLAPPPPPDIAPPKGKPAPAPKPALHSKTIWAKILSILTAAGGFFMSADWRVQLALVVVAGLAAFVIYERLKKDDIAKAPWLAKLLGRG